MLAMEQNSATQDFNLNLSETEQQQCMKFIAVQARVAFTKANRNSGMLVEDFESIGLEVLEISKGKYDPSKGAKFSTFFNRNLRNRLYKATRSTHQKKRGGGGCKQDEIRFGKTERWENGEAQQSAAKLISIESSHEDAEENEGHGLQIAAEVDNSAEYEILLHDVASLMPKQLRAVFKQMIDPDQDLLEAAHKAAIGKNRCTIDANLMAQHLKMDVNKLKSMQREVKAVIAQQFRVS